MESFEKVATVFFGCAIIHTFLVSSFRRMATRYRPGSPAENLFHLLGEVEVVFGLWAAGFFTLCAARLGATAAIARLEAIHFGEAVFVFVIMAMSSTKPVLDLASRVIGGLADLLPLPKNRALVFSLLCFGPLLGSFITEPAAMTVCAFLLVPVMKRLSLRAKYLVLGLLFVNVSVGGTLTHFAAPPILVVSRPWGWDTPFLFLHIGWRAILAVFVSTSTVTYFLRKELDALEENHSNTASKAGPAWNTLIHLGFLCAAVMASHHVTVLFAIFLFFLGWVAVTSEYQSELNIRSALLVGFFLAGLIALGSFQSWWLKPLLSALAPVELFFGATALTAITDNALLTYLGTLVEDFSDSQKLALVSGAVCGGGLTVIANAPNPIGYSVLSQVFGEEGISAQYLLAAAIFPTVVAGVFFLI